MTENDWWSRHVKPRLHNLDQRWLARKVQDVTNKGAPDVDGCFKGNAVKLELKYAPGLPARSDTKLTFSRYSKDEPNRRTILSREQIRNLEEWHRAGGLAFVLIGAGKNRWWLIDIIWLTGNFAHNNNGLTLSQLSEVAALEGSTWESLTMVPKHFEQGAYGQ